MSRLSFLSDVFGKKEDKQKPSAKELLGPSQKVPSQPKFKTKLIERKKVHFTDTNVDGFLEEWEVKNSDFGTITTTAKFPMIECLTYILQQGARKVVIEAGKNISYEKCIVEEEDE